MSATSGNPNLRLYEPHAMPPADALKRITDGRLKGKSSINPQWRIEAMTALCGPIGTGWRYEVAERWTEQRSDGAETAVFVRVAVYYRDGDEWSQPVYGIGGAKLQAGEKKGPYLDPDAPTKATTDALSVALRLIGIGSAVYRGDLERGGQQPEQQRGGRAQGPPSKSQLVGEFHRLVRDRAGGDAEKHAQMVAEIEESIGGKVDDLPVEKLSGLLETLRKKAGASS